MRLQKFLRDQGTGSLRKCDQLVQQGLVRVNGLAVSSPTCILKTGDIIEYGKSRLIFGTDAADKRHYYFLFNKPAGVLCAHSDNFGRKLIFDFLPSGIIRPLFFAGRLDYNSCGLMAISSDGNFINHLTHPAYAATREYLVETRDAVNVEQLKKIAKGVIIEGIKYSPFVYEKLAEHKLKIILNEGKKREIRILIKQIKNQVTRLQRIRMGGFLLGNLAEGRYRELKPAFVKEILKSGGKPHR
ncbi:MAG: hypothetical protein A2096_04995 [Spirochaetes bacterium GWF1_41_5]|nr:MAG: hypothetical protein A2096_04995 [Spirochaetes bacterium GWF1_41_5]HBE03368.1 hypothetical protein [Spirochaetia bacterium]